MWEYWSNKRKSKAVKEGLEGFPALNPETGLAATKEVTVVPDLHADGHDAHHPHPEAEPSRAHVYFKDLKLLVDGDESEEEEEEWYSGCVHPESEEGTSPQYSPGSTHTATPRPIRRKEKKVDRMKLVIILVGLPARGKTFVCNKIMCYFNWLGHPTRHFNVGNYRRSQAPAGEVQDASFFDPANPQGKAARHKALCAALDDMESWLHGDSAQVAIFDATNSTHERRMFLRDRLHGRFEYMFLESICEDQEVLERNYRLKMKFSPDYKGVDMDTALADFKDRIAKYESVYETITDRSLHYVKLIDMVTGRGHMDVNRISGYIPGKMVFFLMQVCKALGRSRRIWLTRHGESQDNVQGKIGGNSSLSIRGAAYQQLLPAVLASRIPKVGGKTVPIAVWTSTLKRTIMTAAPLPYPKVQWKALDEIQAGIFDGMTYNQIKEAMPEEHEARSNDKLRYRYPSGESYMDVIQRLEPVVIEAERDRGCICIVAHQAVLRALYGYFMNRNLEEVPNIPIPLHTLMELTPKADGTMAETRFEVDVDKALRQMEWVHAEDIEIPLSNDSPSTEKIPSDSEIQISDSIVHEMDERLLSSSFPGDTTGGFRRTVSMAELAASELVVARKLVRENED